MEEIELLVVGTAIVGTAIGGAISYFYFQKVNKDLKNEVYKFKTEFLEIENKNINRLKHVEGELVSKNNELKKMRRENDGSEDIVEDLKFENSKVNKINQSLKNEIEQLTSSLREYDMLYNAKKDEIERLKNQLNKEC